MKVRVAGGAGYVEGHARRALALNLGTGRGNSVLQVIGAVEAVAGRPAPTTHCERRTSDPGAPFADGGRACAVLGWPPSHRAMEGIVASAWRWHASERQPGPAAL